MSCHIFITILAPPKAFCISKAQELHRHNAKRKHIFSRIKMEGQRKDRRMNKLWILTLLLCVWPASHCLDNKVSQLLRVLDCGARSRPKRFWRRIYLFLISKLHISSSLLGIRALCGEQVIFQRIRTDLWKRMATWFTFIIAIIITIFKQVIL